jgi:hypothetical protein
VKDYPAEFVATMDGYAILAFAKNKYDERYLAPENKLEYESGVDAGAVEAAAAEAWEKLKRREHLRDEKVSFILTHASVIPLLHSCILLVHVLLTISLSAGIFKRGAGICRREKMGRRMICMNC